MQSLRRYQKYAARDGVFARGLRQLSRVEHLFWSVASGAQIALDCQIGGGLLLLHPSGIVIGPNVSIGPNCLIMHQVTLVAGVRVGGHVDIGAGAKIMSAVRIGDHAVIGANAVVVDDLPEGATAVGIPARIVRVRKF